STGPISAGSSSPSSGRSASAYASAPSGAKSNGSRSILLLRLYRRAGAAALQRSFERVPGQRRAFDPRRKSLDPGQRLQPLGILDQRLRQLRRLAPRHPRMKLRKEGPCLLDRLALEHLGHKRGCRGRDRAAAALKADIGDAVAVERQKDRHPVAAQRVVAL